MTKKIDPDILVLKRCIKGLDGSTSRRMLKANLDFLVDRYITHPTKELPGNLKDKTAEKK